MARFDRGWCPVRRDFIEGEYGKDAIWIGLITLLNVWAAVFETGKVKPGEILTSYSELMNRLKLGSRNPIRSRLRRMESDGVITIKTIKNFINGGDGILIRLKWRPTDFEINRDREETGFVPNRDRDSPCLETECIIDKSKVVLGNDVRSSLSQDSSIHSHETGKRQGSFQTETHNGYMNNQITKESSPPTDSVPYPCLKFEQSVDNLKRNHQEERARGIELEPDEPTPSKTSRNQPPLSENSKVLSFPIRTPKTPQNEPENDFEIVLKYYTELFGEFVSTKTQSEFAETYRRNSCKKPDMLGHVKKFYDCEFLLRPTTYSPMRFFQSQKIMRAADGVRNRIARELQSAYDRKITVTRLLEEDRELSKWFNGDKEMICTFLVNLANRLR